MAAAKKIEDIINYLNINAKVLSEKLGYDRPQIIYDIQRGKTKSISPDLASRITSVYPYISKSWLLADEGEMLNSSPKAKEAEKELSVTQLYKDNMRMAEEIGRLKAELNFIKSKL